ncbi:MAG: class I SAM-dependent methyltransferase [Candidatus Woesearchaeota archaeon]
MDKITNLKKTKGKYSLITEEERDHIIKNIKNTQELENFLFKKYNGYQVKDIFDYLNNSYLLLLDFNDKEVLNIGCGEGPESIFFAKYGAKKVYCLDMNPERLKMLKANARCNNAHQKIITLNGDFKECKINEDSFDIMTMIGVLEWLPEKKPYAEQISYLRKIHKGLKKNGKFLLAIENRINPYYFVGKTHHGDIPFTPLLPRKVADLISRLMRGKPYLTYTHTRAEYLKMFKKAGFKNVKIYPSLFSYQEPRYIINSAKMYKRLLRKYGVSPIVNFCARILSYMPDRLLINLAPAYIVIGEKI